MIRLAAVSYLNTKPFVAGLRHHFGADELELRLQIPARCADSLRRGEVDGALVPVGALPQLGRVKLLNRYCIGADGQVDSVFLFARQPVKQLRTVYLDAHSLTSNGLAKILAASHWGISPNFARPPAAAPDPTAYIQGTAGGVMIGDKALPLRERFPFVYDLAAAWKAMSGLPFVFAVWAVRPGTVSAAMQTRLEEALGWGLQRLPRIAREYARPEQASSAASLLTYFEESIDYTFDAAKRHALDRYLEHLCRLEGLPKPVWA